jgi:hypothetical protein
MQTSRRSRSRSTLRRPALPRRGACLVASRRRAYSAARCCASALHAAHPRWPHWPAPAWVFYKARWRMLGAATDYLRQGSQRPTCAGRCARGERLNGGWRCGCLWHAPSVNTGRRLRLPELRCAALLRREARSQCSLHASSAHLMLPCSAAECGSHARPRRLQCSILLCAGCGGVEVDGWPFARRRESAGRVTRVASRRAAARPHPSPDAWWRTHRAVGARTLARRPRAHQCPAQTGR